MKGSKSQISTWMHRLRKTLCLLNLKCLLTLSNVILCDVTLWNHWKWNVIVLDVMLADAFPQPRIRPINQQRSPFIHPRWLPRCVFCETSVYWLSCVTPRSVNARPRRDTLPNDIFCLMLGASCVSISFTASELINRARPPSASHSCISCRNICIADHPALWLSPRPMLHSAPLQRVTVLFMIGALSLATPRSYFLQHLRAGG